MATSHTELCGFVFSIVSVLSSRMSSLYLKLRMVLLAKGLFILLFMYAAIEGLVPRPMFDNLHSTKVNELLLHAFYCSTLSE